MAHYIQLQNHCKYYAQVLHKQKQDKNISAPIKQLALNIA